MSVKFEDNSAAVKSQMQKNIEKTLVQMGLHWQRRATEIATENIYTRKEAPKRGQYVLTGRYRASLSFITPKMESGLNKQADKSTESKGSDALSGTAPENTVIVGSNLEYSLPIETGTPRMRPRPVVGSAILYFKDEYEKIARDNLGEGFTVSASQTITTPTSSETTEFF